MTTARLARNVPLTADPATNPLLTRTSLLGRLLESFDMVFVLCYRASCNVHTEAGATDGRHMWWPTLQRRVVVFDAAKLDIEHLPILLWAGCDRPQRSVGRSGDLGTSMEPCTMSQNGGGGTDWRRTSKHRLTVLLAHLRLIAEAIKLNLSNVAILEADAVPTLYVESLSRNRSHAQRLAQRLKRALHTNPWKVLRLSGMFYSHEYARPIATRDARRVGVASRGGRRGCSRHCTCSWWRGSELTQRIAPELHLCEVHDARCTAASARPKATNPPHQPQYAICLTGVIACYFALQTAPAPSPSDTILPMIARLDSWCDVRDTAAYAVHRSAFSVFNDLYARLRAMPCVPPSAFPIA